MFTESAIKGALGDWLYVALCYLARGRFNYNEGRVAYTARSVRAATALYCMVSCRRRSTIVEGSCAPRVGIFDGGRRER